MAIALAKVAVRAPGYDHTISLLGPFQNVTVVVGADRVVLGFHDDWVGGPVTEEVQHAKTSHLLGHAEAADTAQGWIEVGFVGGGGIQRYHRGQARLEDLVPFVQKGVAVKAVGAENARV